MIVLMAGAAVLVAFTVASLVIWQSHSYVWSLQTGGERGYLRDCLVMNSPFLAAAPALMALVSRVQGGMIIALLGGGPVIVLSLLPAANKARARVMRLNSQGARLA